MKNQTDGCEKHKMKTRARSGRAGKIRREFDSDWLRNARLPFYWLIFFIRVMLVKLNTLSTKMVFRRINIEDSAHLNANFRDHLFNLHVKTNCRNFVST